MARDQGPGTRPRPERHGPKRGRLWSQFPGPTPHAVFFVSFLFFFCFGLKSLACSTTKRFALVCVGSRGSAQALLALPRRQTSDFWPKCDRDRDRSRDSGSCKSLRVKLAPFDQSTQRRCLFLPHTFQRSSTAANSISPPMPKVLKALGNAKRQGEGAPEPMSP